MTVCTVKGCQSTSGKQKKCDQITFHNFPVDSVIANRWTEIIRRNRIDNSWKPTKFTKICSLHFRNEDMYWTKKGMRRIRRGAVPAKGLYLSSETEEPHQLPVETISNQYRESPDFATSRGLLLPSETEEPHQLPVETINNQYRESPDFATWRDMTPQDLKINEDSLQADDGNEIKVFCPKCNAEISHTAEGIQEDQTKILIAKVYHYFEQEYEELKKSFDGLELTPLSKFRQRTALATGVSETTVVEILQEEARRNAEAREEPSPNESRARKRPRQTDSSSEDDSDNIEDGDDELSSAAHEEETLVVKEEPAEEPLESDNEEPEIYVRMPVPGVSGANDSLADPISLELKTEPPSEEAASSNDTLVAQRDTKSFKRRKMKRRTESPPSTSASLAPNAPQIPNAPPSPNAPPTPNAPPAPPKRQLRLLDDGDIKLEQIDSEEGFS